MGKKELLVALLIIIFIYLNINYFLYIFLILSKIYNNKLLFGIIFIILNIFQLRFNKTLE